MEIMSFKRKRGSMYEIELNTGDKYKVYDDVILKYELLLNRKINKKTLDKVLEESAKMDAYFKGVRYISIKMRTKKEVENYLRRAGFLDSEVEYALKKLEKEGIIDEKKYVAAYINDAIILSLDGPMKIRVSLGKLGIGDHLIDERLSAIDEDIWKERIGKIIVKRSKVNKDSEKVFKLKTTNNLISLGYSIELIREQLSDIKIDTGEAFTRDADRIYEKLKGKFEGWELESKFKSKMYQKGYEVDRINAYLEEK
ncbi:MAG TPA: hypothetical protein DCY94_05195 [Firmicutes bacterium]|nr:hypothetical protein [Bacillota bacterium]